MHFFTTFVAAASVLASVASAAQFNVTVGENGTLTYDPSSITGVQAGDTVAFKFVAKNHTLTQSTFTAPCTPKTGGVNSGFIPVAAGATTFPQWTIQIDNVTAPLWFYCAQAQHCESGMVFAINPTADKSFDAFLNTAKGLTTTNSTSTTGTTAGTTAGTAGTNPAITTPSGSSSGSAASPSNSSGAFTISVQKATTLLAALGLIAGLTL